MDLDITDYKCGYQIKDWLEYAGLFLIFIGYPSLEYWYGKTKKTVAGSLLEHVFILLFRRGRRSSSQKLLTGHVQPEEETMFEGREFEKAIGTVGQIFVDVKPDLTVEAGASLNGKKALQDWAASTKKAWLRSGIMFALSMFGQGAEQVEAASTTEAPKAE